MYAVTVTDDSDISVEETFEIIRLDSIEITPTLIHPDCADEDAILDLEVSGGLGPYTIDWSVTRSCYLGTGLGQAVYYVSVTDECGCISDQSYVLTEPEPIEIVGLIKSTSSCEATDGEIDITVSGGYPPYTFEWTGLDVEVNSMNQSGLSVGLYTVEVTDVTGVCVYTESFGISPEDLLEVNSTYSNPNCNSATGASDGTISLEISGGIPPYFYNWSGPGVIPEEKDQSNLSGGNYIVEVTDAVAQCIYYETYVLKEPESFEIEATLVNPSCNYDNGPANGGIDICIIGGNGGPYTFAWVGPGPAATAQNQAGLGAGTFTVFATDATGLCTQIATYELLEPQELVSNSVIIPSCAEEDGSIIIAASGGTAPYYYEIEGPNGYTSTEQNMSGLSTGSYKVTITDATGICTYEETINLTSGIPTTNLVLPVTDFAEDDDDLLLTGGFPQGGTYSGPGVSNNIFSPSSSGVGTHTITYTYTNTEGCTNSSTQDVVVTEMFVPDPPQNIITENDFGNQEKVTFNPTYNLENDVDVVSMNSSEKIISIVAVASDLTCHPDNAEPDGSITLEVSGGTPPYAYEWTGPGVVASAQNQTNLKAASYRVIVRDVSGLSQIAEFELSEPQAMNVTADITDPSCAYQTGYNDGEIFLVVTGGTVPYTYQWSDGSLGTENTDLDPGTYEVTITDSYGCKLVQSFELQQTTESEITYEQINTDCETERADIRININEGEGPYEITWNSATGGQMDQNFIIIFQEDTGTILYTNAEFGEVYDFTISDANGCLYELTVSINPSLTVEQVNPPHLCLITSDIETDYNTILWEDGEGEKRILFHFIYREDSSTGDFERIGIVEDHKDNTYTDRDVDNQGSAYRYYVTAVDPCYNESEPSAIHKTIHLQINQTESESMQRCKYLEVRLQAKWKFTKPYQLVYILTRILILLQEMYFIKYAFT